MRYAPGKKYIATAKFQYIAALVELTGLPLSKESCGLSIWQE
jgi:hypothetical protein